MAPSVKLHHTSANKPGGNDYSVPYTPSLKGYCLSHSTNEISRNILN